MTYEFCKGSGHNKRGYPQNRTSSTEVMSFITNIRNVAATTPLGGGGEEDIMEHHQQLKLVRDMLERQWLLLLRGKLLLGELVFT
ncbi:hypothetical protein JCGZ_24207 [Jatropha curcas]|uniref:Uncharacterized protein n=1 Tax=Jatropha curcas TaxID=180498 RepID=A0A067L4A4_JATCU|nr:hypothetical protein JCGZ_24207 [Jatropha curcas]